MQVTGLCVVDGTKMCESLLPSRLPWGHLLSQLFHLIYKRLYYVHSCCWFWNATKLDSKIYLISGLIRISLLFAIGLNFKSTTAAAAAVASVVSDSVMRNTGLEEAQAGIKIVGRNINSLMYADDTILMAKSEEKLKSLLMLVKDESEKAGLKFSIQKTKIMATSLITSCK